MKKIYFLDEYDILLSFFFFFLLNGNKTPSATFIFNIPEKIFFSSQPSVIIPGLVFCLQPHAFCVFWGSFIQILVEVVFFFYRPGSQTGDFSRYWPFHAKTLQLFPAPFPTRPSFLLCHAAMCLCIPYQLDKRRERSYSLLPLTFASCFYNLSKACCLHSGTGFVLKKRDNGECHNVIS